MFAYISFLFYFFFFVLVFVFVFVFAFVQLAKLIHSQLKPIHRVINTCLQIIFYILYKSTIQIYKYTVECLTKVSGVILKGAAVDLFCFDWTWTWFSLRFPSLSTYLFCQSLLKSNWAQCHALRLSWLKQTLHIEHNIILS